MNRLRIFRASPAASLLIVLAACVVGAVLMPAGAARALSLQVSVSAPASLVAGDTLTLTVSLDQTITFNGYELFVSWDPTELQFNSATQLLGTPPSGFTLAVDPAMVDPAGLRLTVLALGATSGKDLFSVDYTVQSGLVDDGQVDFKVSQGTTGGLGGAPVPILDNPQGVELLADASGLTVVPEPSSTLLLAAALVATLGLRRRRA